MQIRFLDYDDLADYERDAASNFRDGAAVCTSEWNNTDEIVITSQSPNGKFRVEGNNNQWNVGCQRLFVIVNEDFEEIYKSPFDSIWTSEGEHIKERLTQVHAELLELQANDWKLMPNEEREINQYISDCENYYMPDIF